LLWELIDSDRASGGVSTHHARLWWTCGCESRARASGGGLLVDKFVWSSFSSQNSSSALITRTGENMQLLTFRFYPKKRISVKFSGASRDLY
jgi:hypothetical protein